MGNTRGVEVELQGLFERISRLFDSSVNVNQQRQSVLPRPEETVLFPYWFEVESTNVLRTIEQVLCM